MSLWFGVLEERECVNSTYDKGSVSECQEWRGHLARSQTDVTNAQIRPNRWFIVWDCLYLACRKVSLTVSMFCQLRFAVGLCRWVMGRSHLKHCRFGRKAKLDTMKFSFSFDCLPHVKCKNFDRHFYAPKAKTKKKQKKKVWPNVGAARKFYLFYKWTWIKFLYSCWLTMHSKLCQTLFHFFPSITRI